MSTSTNQSSNDAGRGAIDRALTQIANASGGAMLVEPLSDLSRSDAAYLAERWPALPSATRIAAVHAMREDAEAQIEHNYDRALLVAVLDAEADTRLAAIEGLAELEAPAFCDLLLSIIDEEPDQRVRAAEAMALGRFALQCELGDLDDEVLERLRESLLRLLTSDPSPEVRRRALESAGYLAGDPAVVGQIEEAYESGDHALRVSALHAMGRQADTRWLDIVHHEFASDEPELRFEAVTAAGTIGDERSVVELIDRLRDDDVEVQMAAIAALGAIGGRLAISALRRLTEDDSEAIVDAAEDALEEAQLASNPLRPLT
jgi:HEAT repeat protein